MSEGIRALLSIKRKTGDTDWQTVLNYIDTLSVERQRAHEGWSEEQATAASLRTENERLREAISEDFARILGGKELEENCHSWRAGHIAGTDEQLSALQVANARIAELERDREARIQWRKDIDAMLVKADLLAEAVQNEHVDDHRDWTDEPTWTCPYGACPALTAYRTRKEDK